MKFLAYGMIQVEVKIHVITLLISSPSESIERSKGWNDSTRINFIVNFPKLKLHMEFLING